MTLLTDVDLIIAHLLAYVGRIDDFYKLNRGGVKTLNDFPSDFLSTIGKHSEHLEQAKSLFSKNYNTVFPFKGAGMSGRAQVATLGKVLDIHTGLFKASTFTPNTTELRVGFNPGYSSLPHSESGNEQGWKGVLKKKINTALASPVGKYAYVDSQDLKTGKLNGRETKVRDDVMAANKYLKVGPGRWKKNFGVMSKKEKQEFDRLN